MDGILKTKRRVSRDDGLHVCRAWLLINRFCTPGVALGDLNGFVVNIVGLLLLFRSRLINVHSGSPPHPPPPPPLKYFQKTSKQFHIRIKLNMFWWSRVGKLLCAPSPPPPPSFSGHDTALMSSKQWNCWHLHADFRPFYIPIARRRWERDVAQR